MNSKVSILHISDLHRSRGGEISNSALLSSLVNDKDRYTQSENPIIKTPDIIIVSGDIIRGSTKLVGSELEIQNQYEEGIDFLNQLTNEFLNGDKSKIIVIPGNHDVDFKLSKESMEKIVSTEVLDEKDNLKLEYLKGAINHNSSIRWSWRDLSFYRITDPNKYNNRLEAYANFYSTFYEGQRLFDLDPREQFDIFDYPEFNLTIVAFNSCFSNDHLRFAGDIHPECIAKANLRLREFKRKGRLILGTWHHNTKGLPYDSNYMDSSRLKNFIDSGIVVGLHGHQHKTELIHEYNDVVEQKSILVFSAGTLCGGHNELPTGNNRQYNLIEIESIPENDNIEITLHVREKTESSSFENPIWTAGRIDSKNVSHYTLKIEKPKMADFTTVLIEIERLMNDQKYDEAKVSLLRLNINDEFVRRFLVQCIIQTEDHALAIKVLSNPQTDEETITVLNAIIQLRDKAMFYTLKDRLQTVSSLSPFTKEYLNKAEAILR